MELPGPGGAPLGSIFLGALGSGLSVAPPMTWVMSPSNLAPGCRYRVVS